MPARWHIRQSYGPLKEQQHASGLATNLNRRHPALNHRTYGPSGPTERASSDSGPPPGGNGVSRLTQVELRPGLPGRGRSRVTEPEERELRAGHRRAAQRERRSPRGAGSAVPRPQQRSAQQRSVQKFWASAPVGTLRPGPNRCSWVWSRCRKGSTRWAAWTSRYVPTRGGRGGRSFEPGRARRRSTGSRRRSTRCGRGRWYPALCAGTTGCRCRRWASCTCGGTAARARREQASRWWPGRGSPTGACGWTGRAGCWRCTRRPATGSGAWE